MAMQAKWSFKVELQKGCDLRSQLNQTEQEHWNEWMNSIVDGTREPNGDVSWDDCTKPVKGAPGVWECRLSQEKRIVYRLTKNPNVCTVIMVGVHL